MPVPVDFVLPQVEQAELLGCLAVFLGWLAVTVGWKTPLQTQSPTLAAQTDSKKRIEHERQLLRACGESMAGCVRACEL